MGAQLRRVYRLFRLALHMLSGMVIAHVFLVCWGRDVRGVALIQWWARGMCRILNVQCRVHGDISRAPTLFVANHISWLDIICLTAVLDATFVAKQEVRAWPLFGGMAARAGTLFLCRGDGERTAEVAEQMLWNLLQRRSIVFFPEGTSTGGAGTGLFHARLYQAALHARCPVQAVAVSYPHAQGTHPRAPFIGDDGLVPHLWALLAEPAVAAQLDFCVPMMATGVDRRTLARVTCGQITGVLAGAADAQAQRGFR